jgi:hypothetical protein
LPRNSIDSWDKCKDAFIGKYYPPAKIIALCSDIMKFRQFDNEHVAQAWERMKSMIKNCPTHGPTTWMIVQTFLCRTEFFFKEPIGFSCRRHFYVPYLGRRNKVSRQHDGKLFRMAHRESSTRMLVELHARWEREDEMARKMKVCTITTSNDVVPNASNPLTLIGVDKTPTPCVKKPKTAKTFSTKSAEIFRSMGDDSSFFK